MVAAFVARLIPSSQLSGNFVSSFFMDGFEMSKVDFFSLAGHLCGR